MRTFLAILLAFTVGFATNAAAAGEVQVAAASDLKFALDEIKASYLKANPGDKVDVIYGSSGKLNTQIQQGAPFDLFFSADIAFPQALVKAGEAASDVTPYALGRIVLWSKDRDASKMTLESLKDASIKHIAIADPTHAPYGKRAQEALTAAGVWEVVKPKLVYGETIAQANQFVESGNAEAGIIALSLMTKPDQAEPNKFYLIPDTLHAPLEQAFVITARAKDNAAAKRFAEYMQQPEARTHMVKYGFTLPTDTEVKQ
jgi:molybdate transport system substrate-binding protein